MLFSFYLLFIKTYTINYQFIKTLALFYFLLLNVLNIFLEKFKKNKLSMSIKRWWEDVSHNRELQIGGSNLFTITTETKSRCKKFNCSQHTFNISFNDIEKSFGDAQNEIQRLFTELHDKFLNLMGPKDYIRIVFFHNEFDRPVGYPFMNKNQLETTDLQSTFENVIQSYKQVQINEDNSLTAAIIIAKMPSGGAGSKTKNQNKHKKQQDYFDDSVHTISVENTDNRCLLKSIIIAIAVYDNDKNKIKQLSKPNSLLLHKQAIKISKICGVKNYPCGLEEVKKFEAYFRDYQIMIIQNDGKFVKEPIYLGHPNKKHIYISYTGTHYNVIKSIKRFFRNVYYCHQCKIGYNNLGLHLCKMTCSLCKRG